MRQFLSWIFGTWLFLATFSILVGMYELLHSNYQLGCSFLYAGLVSFAVLIGAVVAGGAADPRTTKPKPHCPCCTCNKDCCTKP